MKTSQHGHQNPITSGVNHWNQVIPLSDDPALFEDESFDQQTWAQQILCSRFTINQYDAEYNMIYSAISRYSIDGETILGHYRSRAQAMYQRLRNVSWGSSHAHNCDEVAKHFGLDAVRPH